MKIERQPSEPFAMPQAQASSAHLPLRLAVRADISSEERVIDPVVVPTQVRNETHMTQSGPKVGGGESPRGSSGVVLDDRLLASLAREVEESDPIAWGALDLDRDAAYRLMASQIAEMFRDHEKAGRERDEQLLLALASCVKLAVENFVLHQRLMLALRQTRILDKSAE